MKRSGVKAIEIFDDVMDESFLVAINENNKIIFSTTVPINLNNYTKFTESIYKINGDIKENTKYIKKWT